MVEDTQKRYADDITLQELVRLRVENERLRGALQTIESDRAEWSDGVGKRVVYYADKIKSQADEIERLREFAKAVVRYAGNSGDDYLADKARSALQQKDTE